MPKITYSHDAKGNIILPKGAPFDGVPVLVKFASGWCEAWFDKGISGDDGWCWVLLDDSAPQQELDDALFWLPLPTETTDDADEATE
jgi:hypothetical protein